MKRSNRQPTARTKVERIGDDSLNDKLKRKIRKGYVYGDCPNDAEGDEEKAEPSPIIADLDESQEMKKPKRKSARAVTIKELMKNEIQKQGINLRSLQKLKIP